MMEIGIGARMLRENNIKKNILENVRDSIRKKLEKRIFEDQKYYKANIYLVRAKK